jgi:hypothetical protein
MFFPATTLKLNLVALFCMNGLAREAVLEAL